MRLLAIDTSNQPLTVATAEDDSVLAELTTNTRNTHGECLMPAIAHVIELSPFAIGDVDRFVIAKGPGSYTGLRIGATTAKTLAWTLSKELVAVSSLALIAANCTMTADYIVPIFDARRGNLYSGLYQYHEGNLMSIIADRHMAADEWIEILKKHEGNFILVGTDATKFYADFKEALQERVTLAPANYDMPRASMLAQLGRRYEAVDIHTFKPDYLKQTEAEENWLSSHPDTEETTYVEEI